MTETEQSAVCEQVAGQRLPRWDELPDLELYMDQVLSLMERYLGAYPGFDRKGLTASMVNNYVKSGVMPAPVKKKYARAHLAHLIMICVLKTVFPIEQIKTLILASASEQDDRTGYNRFCDEFENALSRSAEDMSRSEGLSAIYRAALRAQAEQALALRLYGAAFPPTEKGKK